MEPLNDDELKLLFAEWRAPDLPPNLRNRVLASANARWRIPSHIRVPTPVAALVLAAMLALGLFALRSPQLQQPSGFESSLASFEAVEDPNLRIVRLPDEVD